MSPPRTPNPSRHRRRARWAVALLVVVAPAVRAETINRVVLQVNSEVLTLRDFESQLELRRAAIGQSKQIADTDRERALARAPREVLREALEEMLVAARAEQLRIRVNDTELAAAVAEIRQSNRLETDEELRKAVEQSGMNWDDFRDQLKKNLRYRELMGREVASRINLEEDDLRIYYRDNPEQFRLPEERRLREIVVLDSSPLSEVERATLANQVRDRLLAGEEPSLVVAETAAEGKTSGVIDLDWIPKGDLDPNLEAAVANLKPGQASIPVQGRGGLHVVQLVERKEASLRPFDAVKDEIYDRERQRLFAKEYPKYLRELEAKAYIVANPPPGAEDFRETATSGEAPDPLDAFRKQVDAAEKAPAAPAPPPGG